MIFHPIKRDYYLHFFSIRIPQMFSKRSIWEANGNTTHGSVPVARGKHVFDIGGEIGLLTPWLKPDGAHL